MPLDVLTNLKHGTFCVNPLMFQVIKNIGHASDALNECINMLIPKHDVAFYFKKEFFTSNQIFIQSLSEAEKYSACYKKSLLGETKSSLHEECKI